MDLTDVTEVEKDIAWISLKRVDFEEWRKEQLEDSNIAIFVNGKEEERSLWQEIITGKKWFHQDVLIILGCPARKWCSLQEVESSEFEIMHSSINYSTEANFSNNTRSLWSASKSTKH